MRKGYRTADARLRSFENGLFCCKLTVASGIQKGLLHVSLDTVEKRCRGMLIQSLLNLETFQKDLIGFVRSCWLGVLIRGLQNLELPKGNDFILFACTKRTKSTPKGCDPLDSRGRFKSPLDSWVSAEMTGIHHVTGRAGYCSLSGYRR